MQRIEINTLSVVLLLILAFIVLCGCSGTYGPIFIKPLPCAQTSQFMGTLKSYMIGGSGLEAGMSITCVQDGSCLLFGESIKSFNATLSYLALKISPDQKITWAKTYGKFFDRALHVVPSRDGGYLLVGLSRSMLANPLWLQSLDKCFYPLIIKIDPVGKIEWARVVEYISKFDFMIYSTIQTSDGGYVFSGKHGTNLLFKLTERGDFLWGNSYSLASGKNTYQYRVVEAGDGKLMISFDVYVKDKPGVGLLMTDQQGQPLWAKIFNSKGAQAIRQERLIKDEKGVFTIASANLLGDRAKGTVAIAILRVNSQGNMLWGQQYTFGRVNIPATILKGYNKNLLVAGITGEDALAFRYKCKGTQNGSVNAFAFLIDESGNIVSSFVSTRKLLDAHKSATKALGKYFFVGEFSSSRDSGKILFSIWKPQREAAYLNPNSWSRMPFEVEGEATRIETQHLKLDNKAIKGFVNVQELPIMSDKVGN